MNSNIIYKISLFFITVISLSGLFLLSACEKLKDAKKMESDPIEITSINLSKSTVNMNETISVTIIATDEEGRTLNYDFSANGGSFSNVKQTNNTANWTAPFAGGTYTITGRVFAGDDEDSASVNVTVLDEIKPVITLVYPLDGNYIPVVNHQEFTFNAYHPNGVSETDGLIIDFFIGSSNYNSRKSNVQRNNPSGDNKNYIFSFDLDLSNISGDCRLEYKVQSTAGGVDSDVKTVLFKVEGVGQNY
jgi:hypothetical protein